MFVRKQEITRTEIILVHFGCSDDLSKKSSQERAERRKTQRIAAGRQKTSMRFSCRFPEVDGLEAWIHRVDEVREGLSMVFCNKVTYLVWSGTDYSSDSVI